MLTLLLWLVDALSPNENGTRITRVPWFIFVQTCHKKLRHCGPLYSHYTRRHYAHTSTSFTVQLD